MLVVVVAVVASIAVLLRLIYILLTIYWGTPVVVSQGTALRTMVVLGSGGHTTEMLKLVAALDPKKYNPRVYLIADTDKISLQKLLVTEENFEQVGSQHIVEVVPRTREVGQSWVSTAFTTLHALAYSLSVLARHQPILILANGPGTCVPLCYGAFVLRVLGLCQSQVVFVESLCRVRSLSLSGRLLYPIVDHFLVQWPQLVRQHPRAHYLGRLV